MCERKRIICHCAGTDLRLVWPRRLSPSCAIMPGLTLLYAHSGTCINHYRGLRLSPHALAFYGRETERERDKGREIAGHPYSQTDWQSNRLEMPEQTGAELRLQWERGTVGGGSTDPQCICLLCCSWLVWRQFTESIDIHRILVLLERVFGQNRVNSQ